MSKVKDLFRNIWLNIKGFVINCILIIWLLIGSVYLFVKLMYWIYVLQLTLDECATKLTNSFNNWCKPFGRSISKEETEEIMIKHFIK